MSLRIIRFIYAAQDVELVSYVAALHASNPDNQTVVLFPSKRAVSADDFMKKWTQANVTRDTIRKEEVCRTANSEDTSTLKTRKLTIIVVVGVMWRFG
jgi:inner membrane protein involved in colicin E2 resistance